MRPIQRLIGLSRRFTAERHAWGRSILQLAAELEASGQKLDAKIAGKPDTVGNREALAHWVGIERWSQRRLRVALGERFLADEYHAYRPDVTVGLEGLRKSLVETRAGTVELARHLHEAGVDPTFKIRHNDMGDVSVTGWLSYLLQHPVQESIGRLRG
jgi:hypothetical protein